MSGVAIRKKQWKKQAFKLAESLDVVLNGDGAIPAQEFMKARKRLAKFDQLTDNERHVFDGKPAKEPKPPKLPKLWCIVRKTGDLRKTLDIVGDFNQHGEVQTFLSKEGAKAKLKSLVRDKSHKKPKIKRYYPKGVTA